MAALEVVDVEEAGAHTKIVTDEEAERAELLEPLQQSDAAAAAVLQRRTPRRMAAGAASVLLVFALVAGLRTPLARKQKNRRDCQGGICQAGTSSLDATLMLKTGPPIDSSIACPSGYESSTANLKGPKTTSYDTIDDCAAKCSAETTCPGFEFGGKSEGDHTMECYVFDEDHVEYSTQKQQFITCLKPKLGVEAPMSGEEEEEEKEEPETDETPEEEEAPEEGAASPVEGETNQTEQPPEAPVDIDGCKSWCEEKGDWGIVCQWPECLACASCAEE